MKMFVMIGAIISLVGCFKVSDILKAKEQCTDIGGSIVYKTTSSGEVYQIICKTDEFEAFYDRAFDEFSFLRFTK